MDPRAIHDFVRRDRTAVDVLKRAHWARRFRVEGAAATIAASRALYEHVRNVRPDYPSPREREDDLAHHLELKRKLDQASCALPIR